MTAAYGSPGAFRAALTTKLRTMSDEGPWPLHVLQRQIAYDRLLERLYMVDDVWIVKGATALLAREIGVRGSMDVDVYRAAAMDMAESDLREAVSRDLRDWFRFDVGRAVAAGGGGGVRLSVDAFIGPTIWSQFHVDLVGADLRMTGAPERVPPVARVAIPDLEQHGYVAYPLVDHVADKVAATFELHGATGEPSTRYRDLVDLVAIVRGATVEAAPQVEAVRSEFRRRALAFPASFDIPDQRLWRPGYAREAASSLLEVAQTLDEALDVVRAFVDPVLRAEAVGSWLPATGRWSG